jgi:hypothetical protein
VLHGEEKDRTNRKEGSSRHGSRDRSRIRSAFAPSATSRLLLDSPKLNLGTQPELDAPVSEVEHWRRHVVVPMLVDAHRVAVGETEKVSDSIGVKEIVYVDPATHAFQITVVLGSIRSVR